MAKENIKLAHALHNEEVCSYLYPNVNYVDWVITTAFYSSIHYVDNKLFPFKVTHENGGKFTIKNIDECYNVFAKNCDKHTYRTHLVEDRCNEIFSSFKWLRDLSRTARYINYKFKNPEAILKQAKLHLEVISKYCK